MKMTEKPLLFPPQTTMFKSDEGGLVSVAVTLKRSCFLVMVIHVVVGDADKRPAQSLRNKDLLIYNDAPPTLTQHLI